MISKIFIRILNYIKPYKKHFILGSLLAFLFSITNGITLYSIVPIFNTLSPGNQKYQVALNSDEQKILESKKVSDINDRITLIKASIKKYINRIMVDTGKFELLIYLCAGLFLIFFIRTILDLLVVYYIGYAGNGAIKDIRQNIYKSMIILPLSFYHRQKTGELISKIIYDTDLISGALSNQLRKFIVNLFIVITHLLLLFYINNELTFLAIIMLVFITAPILFLGSFFKKYSFIEQESMSEISSNIIESINGIRIIKSYQMEEFQLKRFMNNARTLFRKKIQKSIIEIIRPHLVEVIASLFVVFLFISGGTSVINGEYSKGEFLFFVLTFLFLMNPLKQIANMNNQIKQAEAAGERIFSIIDSAPEYSLNSTINDFGVYTLPGKEVIIPEKGIAFSNVSFKYSDTDSFAIENLTLFVKTGERIAIVGKSGAGKSTLVDLIPRFYDAANGSIYFDDIDIRTIPLQRLRNSIGIVSQEVILFNGSVKDNIAYGLTEYTFEAVRDAALIANAHEFIMKMPDKYETIIGERGINISGGERQRIAIARTVLRNPPILILDEATSSLDSKSEMLVQEALDRLMTSRTTFVIAHKLSTIINADKIIVLEKGKIAECGSHKELLMKDGIYKNLYELQLS